MRSLADELQNIFDVERFVNQNRNSSNFFFFYVVDSKQQQENELKK